MEFLSTVKARGNRSTWKIVQTAKNNSGDQSVTSRTSTFGAAPTSGNIIVAAASLRLRSEVITFSDGTWNYVYQRSDNNPSAAIAWKVSDGTETDIIASHPGTAQRMAISIIEIENIKTTSINSNFTVSGSTGAFSTNTISGETSFPQMALAIWAGDDDGTDIGSRSYNNGFIEIDGSTTRPDSAFRVHVIMASQTIINGSGECTLTTINSTHRGLGSIIMFENQ